MNFNLYTGTGSVERQKVLTIISFGFFYFSHFVVCLLSIHKVRLIPSSVFRLRCLARDCCPLAFSGDDFRLQCGFYLSIPVCLLQEDLLCGAAIAAIGGKLIKQFLNNSFDYCYESMFEKDLE